MRDAVAVAPLRRDLVAEARATIRFETRPGEQLQIDFGERRVEIGGVPAKVFFFMTTLGRSRRLHVRAFGHERQDSWFAGVESAFAAFGGVPREVLPDNARALILRHDPLSREVILHPRLHAFARHLVYPRGLRVRDCAPGRTRTKGKDERGVGPATGSAQADRPARPARQSDRRGIPARAEHPRSPDAILRAGGGPARSAPPRNSTVSPLAMNRPVAKFFAEAAGGVLTVEQALHARYLQEFGVTPDNISTAKASPDCLAYTNFLLATAHEDPWEVLVAAVLPCIWIYRDVGLAIAGQAASGNPYRPWIDTRSDEHFGEAVRRAIVIADTAAEAASVAGRRRMFAAFQRSSQFEWLFWDSAYQGRGWPVVEAGPDLA